MNPREFGYITSSVMQKKIDELRRGGAVFLDRNNVYIGPDVKIDRGTLVHPGVMLIGKTEIGENCEIEMGVKLENMKVGDGSTIHTHCYLAHSRVGSNCELWSGVRVYNSWVGDDVIIHGPNRIVGSKVGHFSSVDSFCLIKYAIVGPRCRVGPHAILEGQKLDDKALALGCQTVKISMDCVIGAQAHIHDWAVIDRNAEVSHGEVVRSYIGKRTIAKHHGYIGDAEIHEDCNVGAGAVFGNYDGQNKHKIVVEAGVFIGIHTSIVSAKTGRIGKEAFIAADTLIREEVEPGTVVVRKVNPLEVLAYSRRTKDGWKIRKTKPRKPRKKIPHK